MNLEKYEELTGITVPDSQVGRVNAAIRRSKSLLETQLGFTLKPKNLYSEKGKVTFEGSIPLLSELDNATLLPPDAETNIYKLFPFRDVDRYFHVDPFTDLYKAKLVVPTTDGEFITVVDLDNVVTHSGRDRISKYIERHNAWFTWLWYKTWAINWNPQGDAGLMLAVDAAWIDCYPDDLMYLWADVVTYLVDPAYSVTGNIRSESVDGHSWSKGGNSADGQKIVSPYMTPDGAAVLTRYAGPYGHVLRNPVR